MEKDARCPLTFNVHYDNEILIRVTGQSVIDEHNEETDYNTNVGLIKWHQKDAYECQGVFKSKQRQEDI